MARNFNNVTTDYIDLGNDTSLPVSTLPISVFAWIYTNSNSTTQFIIQRGKGGGWSLNINNGANSNIEFTKLGVVDINHTFTNFTTSGWMFVAAVATSNNVRLILILSDSTFEAYNVADSNSLSNAGTTTEIGRFTNGAGVHSDPFNGKIAYVGVSTVALTDNELKEIAISSGTIPIRDLAGLWRLEGNSPEIDYSGNGFSGTVNGTTVVADPTSIGTEALTFTDSIIKAVNKAISDNPAFADIVAKYGVKAITDNPAFIDSVAATVTHGGPQRTAAETIQLTDTITRTITKAIADGIITSETISLQYPIHELTKKEGGGAILFEKIYFETSRANLFVKISQTHERKVRLGLAILETQLSRGIIPKHLAVSKLASCHVGLEATTYYNARAKLGVDTVSYRETLPVSLSFDVFKENRLSWALSPKVRAKGFPPNLLKLYYTIMKLSE